MDAETTTEESGKTADLFADHLEKTAKQAELQTKLIEELSNLAKQQAAPKPEPAKRPERYTPAQLQAAVEAGTITEAVARETLRAYDREDLKAELRQELRQEVQSTTAQSKVQARIDEFIERIPALRQNGSEEWNLAAKAFKVLVEDGNDPKDPKTELAAIRMAFPEGKVKEAPRETTAQRQRTVESTGTSSGRSAGKSKADSGKWPSYLPEHVVDYYEKAIEKGRYSGRKDPMLVKELEIRERRHKEGAAA